RILSLSAIVQLDTVIVPINGVDTTLVRGELHFDRIAKLLTDPLIVFHDAYGWGDNTFDGTLLFANGREVFDALTPIAAAHKLNDDGPPDLDLFGLLIRATTDATHPGIEGTLFVDFEEGLDLTSAELTDECRIA